MKVVEVAHDIPTVLICHSATTNPGVLIAGHPSPIDTQLLVVDLDAPDSVLRTVGPLAKHLSTDSVRWCQSGRVLLTSMALSRRVCLYRHSLSLVEQKTVKRDKQLCWLRGVGTICV